MHAKIPRIPAYRRHAASGKAVVTLAGRDVYLGEFGSKASVDAYRRHVARWLDPDFAAAANAADGYVVNELIVAYLEHAETYYRTPDRTQVTTHRDKIKQAVRPLAAMYGSTMTDAFDAEALTAVRDEMIRSGNARSTINGKIDTIRSMFRWGVTKKLVSPTTLTTLEAVASLAAYRTEARETEPVRPVPSHVVEATITHVPPMVAAMIRVQQLTGARSTEVCSLRPCDITFAKPVWTYKPVRHKNTYRGKDREIFIGPKAQAILRPYLTGLNPTDYIFSPARSETERLAARSEARTTPRWASHMIRNARKRAKRRALPPGDTYDQSAYRRAVQRGADAADRQARDEAAKAGKPVPPGERLIPRWHPHQLRHAAGTAARRTDGIEAAQAMLGHSSLQATQLYAERQRDAALKLALKIG